MPSSALTTVAQLLDGLKRTAVLSPRQLEETEQVLQGQFADAQGLARELVRRGWLTPFQVNRLVQGRHGELTVGQYVVLEPLGEGGMGQVFKVRHRVLERVQALKLIQPRHVANADAVRRLQREARAVA